MAKGIYVGVGGQIVKGDIIPKTWSGSNSPYSASGAVLYASGEYSGYPAKYACDGDTKTNYQSNNVTACWLKLAFLQPQKITKMKTWITALSDSYFSSAVIQGSNNDSTWTELYKITSPQTALTEITLNNTNNYYYYRIYATSTNASRPPIIYEWQASEYVQNPVARKVKKAYIGVGGKARKVKKGYIGVGGIARLFFSAEQRLEYYGTAASLLSPLRYLAATTVGQYALFGGGTDGDGNKSTSITGYKSTLTRGTTTLSYARSHLAATTVGEYALFGGGNGGSASAIVDTYTSKLSKSTATELSLARYDLAATTVGQYALFGGGNNGSRERSTVDSYSSSLVKGTAASLSAIQDDLAATTIGNYALFGGVDSNIVDTYTSSLVKSTATELSQARYNLAATTVGNYALFGGGSTGSYYATVDTYTSSLVKGTATDLSVGREYLSAITVGDYALFAGGKTNSASSVVDVYNTSLLKGTATSLSQARYDLAAATIGNYALFGGGNYNNVSQSKVDVYQVV